MAEEHLLADIPHRRVGCGLVIHGYVTYRGNSYTEEKIQQEMTKLP